MASNANLNDIDDLDDLDYGDDDLDLDSKTGQSQNSGTRTSTQEVDDDEEDEQDDYEQDDEEDIEDKDGDERSEDNTDDHHILTRGFAGLARGSNPNINGQGEKRRGQKRKHKDEDEDEDDDEQDCDQSKSGDKANVERCKFWPYCTAGDECAFYHPTKPCRTFPNCRFGSNCLYIHPPCKYLPFCTRSDCPFAHPAKQTSAMRGRGIARTGRPQVPMTSQFRPQTIQQPVVPKCKFGFKCANLMCKFSHQASEPCRYGANCLLENCAFTHPTDQHAHQQKKSTNVFKWSAKS